MESLHTINIVVHIIAGTLALFTGFCALIVRKTIPAHRRAGRYFMWMMVVITITGLTGVLVFGRNPFLLVLTLLSGYNCFSGIRVMQTQHPGWLDYTVALLVAGAGFIYLHIMSSYWSPAVIYSTLGALFLVVFFDLSKDLMPATWHSRTRIYEHIYKMISALSGLASAFSGTVFPQYKPWSQLLPAALAFTGVMIIFINMGYKQVVCARQ